LQYSPDYRHFDEQISKLEIPPMHKWRIQNGKWRLLTDLQMKTERKKDKKAKPKPTNRQLIERAKTNPKAAKILLSMQATGTHK
jgi:hypothetical protein